MAGLLRRSSDGVWTTKFSIYRAAGLDPALVVSSDYRRQCLILTRYATAFVNPSYIYVGGLKGIRVLGSNTPSIVPPIILRRSELGDIVCGEIWFQSTLLVFNVDWYILEVLNAPV